MWAPGHVPSLPCPKSGPGTGTDLWGGILHCSRPLPSGPSLYLKNSQLPIWAAHPLYSCFLIYYIGRLVNVAVSSPFNIVTDKLKISSSDLLVRLLILVCVNYSTTLSLLHAIMHHTIIYKMNKTVAFNSNHNEITICV